jgi:hypothetical protein
MSAAYELIRGFYGERRARRSGVLLLQHIDEGLTILDAIGASSDAKDAYCLHPILQSDADLTAAFAPGGALDRVSDLSPRVLVLAMEYRSVANAYLSTRCVTSPDEIRLSPLAEVQQMLVADKIQNRKDFERHHKGIHPRSEILDDYFRRWLARLEITDDRYRELVAHVHRHHPAPAEG